MGETGDPFFPTVAAADGPSDTYRRLKQGPRQRTDRIRRRLQNGADVDICSAVLMAIAHTGPKMTRDWTDIRAALREVLRDEPPGRAEYTRVLEKMSEIARAMVWHATHERAIADPVLEYDTKNGQLHISDPFFAYQLRWGPRREPPHEPTDPMF